jgi:RNA polymerase sigma-70 factor (ECF subfamily)
VIGRVVSDEFDVDEVFQETLLELWKNAGHYVKERGQAIGWIVTVARRRAIDRVRRKLTYTRAKDRYAEHINQDSEGFDCHNAEAEASSSDLRQVFAELLESLPDAQREALTLNMYNGLSQREIAAKTRIPLGTIKTRLELAIRKVRAAILTRGDREQWLSELTA